MNVLGIDPGKSGGIAVVRIANNEIPKIVKAMKMPTLIVNTKKIIDIISLNNQLKDISINIAVIEKAHAMPRQGVTSSFQFGRSYGAVESLCQMITSRIDYVSPSVWKKAMGLSSSKQASLDLAKLKFGDEKLWDIKSNDGIAEAALICLFWIERFNKKIDIK